MLVINGMVHYTPKEIAEQGLIVNSRGKRDYSFVLRLVRAGKLEYRVFNEESKIPYYLIPETEIERYNNRFNLT